MDTDIRDELERCFDEGPTPPPTDLVVALGRRALRRRRLAETGSAVAVAVVTVGAIALAGSGSVDDAAPAPTLPAAGRSVDPTPAPEASRPAEPRFPPAGAPVVRDERLSPELAVDLRPDGLHAAPGVRVLEVVDDPWRIRADGSWSVAARYRDARGVTTWWAGYLGPRLGGEATSIPAANAGDIDFDTWVAEQRMLYNQVRPTDPPLPAGGWPGMTDLQLVRFTGDGERVEPLDAVTLLARRAHPDLPESWAKPGDRSAAAEVSFEGRRYYVLARWSDGDVAPQYVAVAADRGGATLDDFLDLARQRYAEGGGGQL